MARKLDTPAQQGPAAVEASKTAMRNRMLASLLREWREEPEGFSDEFWDELESELQAEREKTRPAE